MANYPKDQFDDFPEDLARIGAHRGPVKRGGGWIGFAWAALATGALVAAGLFYVSLTNESFKFDFGTDTAASASPSASAIPTAEPITEKSVIKTLKKERGITITVLNGSATDDLDRIAYRALKADQWPATSYAPASVDTEEETIVYYSNADDEDVARGVIAALGTGDVSFSEAFSGAPITVVLGSDYAAIAAG